MAQHQSDSSSASLNIGERRVHVHDFSGKDDLSPADMDSVERMLQTELEARRQHLSSQYKVVHQASVKLNSGHSMPLVGLGTWKSGKGEVRDSVIAAIKSGYRHVDCAYIYENEHEIGEALSSIWADGIVKREDVFITSKLWNTYHAANKVREACLKTLQDLRLEYLDLYLIHWPVTGNRGPTVQPPIEETWRAMEALVQEGLVRSIGVSNFSIAKLEDMKRYERITPAVNQVEVHPYWRNDALIQYCSSRGIHVTAYSPLGSPDSASITKRADSVPKLMEDALVQELAAKYGKDVGQILIRWAIQHGTSVLPKSVNSKRIASNLDVFEWQLSAEDYNKLSSLHTQMRMVDGSFWIHPDGPYRTFADLWDEPTQVSQQEAERQKALAEEARKALEKARVSDQAALQASAPGAGTAQHAQHVQQQTSSAQHRAESAAPADVTPHAAPAGAAQQDASARHAAGTTAQHSRAGQDYRRGIKVPSAKLNTGAEIPLIGLGTWKAEKGGQVKEAVKAAIRLGYRHIDCAYIYQNEAEVGEALQEILAEGVVTRSDLFITSKLWNADHDQHRVEPAIRRSLQDLKLDYLDLYLVHWPVTPLVGPELRPPLSETWAAMEQLVDRGLARAIGVSNFSIKKCQQVMQGARIMPAVNQVEAHPYWRNDSLIHWCKEHSIHVTAYSPLGSPDSSAMFKRSEDVPKLMEDPLVQEIAHRLHKTPAQVLVRWAVQRGTSVLPKSTHPERIASNLDVLDWELDAEEMVSLSALPYQQRMVDGSFWVNPNGPYKTLQDLWDE